MLKAWSKLRGKPVCPQCPRMELRRDARQGFWQTRVFWRLGFFPWECGQCRRVYLRRLRSTGYRQRVEMMPEAAAAAVHARAS